MSLLRLMLCLFLIGCICCHYVSSYQHIGNIRSTCKSILQSKQYFSKKNSLSITPHIQRSHRYQPGNVLSSSSPSAIAAVSVDGATDNGHTKKTSSSLLQTFLNKATNLFPLWVLSFSIIGVKTPQLLTWFTPYVTSALAITMMMMGMTLTKEDFQRISSTPQYTLLGFVTQYTIMPLSAYFYSKLFHLNAAMSTGLILVGSCPGGTASNLVTLIGNGDLALSITMTAVSTIAAIFMTPFLVTRLAGQYVAVKSTDLIYSVFNVIFFPIFIGLLLNAYLPKQCSKVVEYSPIISVILVALICGSVSATNASLFLVGGSDIIRVVLAVVALHSTGFGLGYLVSKLVGAGDKQSKTVSIETGMQNSSLAVVLAKHFPSLTAVSLPGAISATTHSIIGSLLASYWRSCETKSSDTRT